MLAFSYLLLRSSWTTQIHHGDPDVNFLTWKEGRSPGTRSKEPTQRSKGKSEAEIRKSTGKEDRNRRNASNHEEGTRKEQHEEPSSNSRKHQGRRNIKIASKIGLARTRFRRILNVYWLFQPNLTPIKHGVYLRDFEFRALPVLKDRQQSIQTRGRSHQVST